MNERDLKPCPFCGGTPTMRDVDIKALGGTGYCVECMNEDCMVNVCTRRFDTEDEAIEAWNQRAGGIKVIKPNTKEWDREILNLTTNIIHEMLHVVDELADEDPDTEYLSELMSVIVPKFHELEGSMKGRDNE